MNLFKEVIVVPNIDYIDDKITEAYERDRGWAYRNRSILLTFEELDRLQGRLQNQLRYMSFTEKSDWPHDQKHQVTYRGHSIVTTRITNSLDCDICTKNEAVYEYNIKLCELHYKILRTMEKFNE